jgi:hypothetical protein
MQQGPHSFPPECKVWTCRRYLLDRYCHPHRRLWHPPRWFCPDFAVADPVSLRGESVDLCRYQVTKPLNKMSPPPGSNPIDAVRQPQATNDHSP